MIYAKPTKQDIKMLILIERQRKQIEKLWNKKYKDGAYEQSKTNDLSKL